MKRGELVTHTATSPSGERRVVIWKEDRRECVEEKEGRGV